MTATMKSIIIRLSHMIKDQRGHTVENFEEILEELVKEIIEDTVDNRTTSPHGGHSNALSS